MGKRFPTVLLLSAWLGSACARSPLPADTAATVERRQCTPDVADLANIRLLKTATVLEASPILTHMLTGNNNSEDRVAGAKIVIRPPDGISVDRMTRLLQCHSARALLGQIDVSEWPDDPFWLPGAWLDIEVRPEGGNYVVSVETDSVRNNLKIAARAKAFATVRLAGNAHLLP
jgi:hypothetical protein